jgi:deoxyribodipyrimidine photo-lyase
MINQRVTKVLPATKEHTKVLYVMCNTFRVRDNFGLNEAYGTSKYVDVILFKEKESHPRTNQFFENGLQETLLTLNKIVNKVMYIDNREKLDEDLFNTYDLVIKDKGYLTEEKEVEKQILEILKTKEIGLWLVESNVIVPTHVVTNKEEYSAATIRKKIWKQVPLYLQQVLQDLKMLFQEQKAYDILDSFLESKLELYHLSNDPSIDVSSGLSPYLKYGFISPITIYRRTQELGSRNVDAFLEQLIVRRELAYNFVEYNPQYNQFEHITYNWAYQSMNTHLLDNREYLYTKEDYISFATHDIYFNHAMMNMVHHGTMHNYMRMYWCKKILEWSPSYEIAYQTAIELNNHYFIDGNTPNGYTGVAWCFGKHDRAWAERLIFGKIRYMNQNGLIRKFDMDKYLKKIKEKCGVVDE